MSKGEELIPKPRSTFLRVRCPSCGNEQVIFGRAAIEVRCNICNEVLAQPLGGKAKVRGEVLAVLE